MEDPEELELTIEDIMHEIAIIKSESEMMEFYFDKTLIKTEEHKKVAKVGHQKRRRMLPSTLTMDQKLNIANVSMEIMQKEFEESKKTSEKLIDTLKAVLEETDARIAELKKDAYDFKRDVVVGAENMRTGKTVAEKVIKYMEEKLRQKDAIIEKLRLKNASLKNQIVKAEAQLGQKEEMGDILHYIDFHQLQIENKQYVAKIEELNEDLLKFKMTTGKTVKVLNKVKSQLGNLMSDSERLDREIKNRTELLTKVKEENSTVTSEIVQEKRTRKHLNQQQADTSHMPKVTDYIAQKAEVYELEDVLRNWERKVEILEIAAKKARSIQNMHKRAMKQGKIVAPASA